VAQSIVQVPVWSYARARRYPLSTTGVVTVVALTLGGRAVGLTVMGSVAVVNAATALGVTLSWTDPDAGPQTLNWFSYNPSQPVAVGAYNLAPAAIMAQAGTSVSITAQAGTAGNVLITADVWGSDE
jgi:hypothetical protein